MRAVKPIATLIIIIIALIYFGCFYPEPKPNYRIPLPPTWRTYTIGEWDYNRYEPIGTAFIRSDGEYKIIKEN